MEKKSKSRANHRPVCAWISFDEHDKLTEIARRNNLTISAYMRALVVDAIVEDYGVNE